MSEFPDRFLSIICTVKQREAYKDIEALFDAFDEPYSEDKHVQLIEHIEAQFREQLWYFSHLLYARMEMSGNWGDPGEQQVKVSFCRLLLDLTPDVMLTHDHAMEFSDTIRTNLMDLGLDSLSLDALNEAFETFRFDFCGTALGFHDIEEMNAIMQFVGSKWYIQGGYYGHDKEMILGLGSDRKVGDYQVISLDRELIRTPNTVVPMAAVIGNEQIFVRREALLSIFYQKWMPVVSPASMVTYPGEGEGYRLSGLIKSHAVKLYGVLEPHEFLSRRETFLGDMKETITYHELGHAVIQHHLLPYDIGALGEASKVCGETVFMAILELLAEIAPLGQSFSGPLYHMCEEAEDYLPRAERMFWTYVSDTWFYDTQDSYMFLYSDLMSLFLSRYIQSDLSVDFVSMKRDLVVRDGFFDEWESELVTLSLDEMLQRYEDGEWTFLEWVVGAVSVGANRMLKLIREAVYFESETLSGDQAKSVSYSFEERIPGVKKELEKKTLEVDDASYAYRTAFYAEFLDLVMKQSDSEFNLNELTSSFERDFLDAYYRLDSGDATGSYDPQERRDYLFSKYARAFDGA